MERLLLISPGLANGRIELRPSDFPVTLGRSRTCEVTIDDPLLSRKHSEIRLTDAGLVQIHDLESTNLTIVNEVDISSHTLRSGDRILLGETEILVEVIYSKDDANEKTTRDLTMLPSPQDETVDE